MSILVTGGAGYIGSHTCVELLDAGKDIIIVDNFSNSKPEALERIKKITNKDFKFYEADLLDREAMERIFEENKIEAVVHFAGLKAVGESVSIPLKYYHNNITGTLILCETMTKYGCKKMVFSSSATVYGMNNIPPYDETMSTSATNPYGRTKLMIEEILKDLCVSDSEWTAVMLRYFNPIGAHKSGLIGEEPNGIPNNLLPYVARVANGKLQHLNVYGNDYDTPDGTGVRDYIHVVDLAKGHLKALDYALVHTGAKPVNLGTGNGYSVLEVVKAFEKASGKPVPYVIAPRRPGDVATSFANASEAAKVFGWKAELGIDEMCEDAWRFESNNK
ncbi:MAG: UDP-glucose 4-epimerase GalE [Oscillospiraceae bacterium]|nr:UDP-glucose 4-epimerase GalE [Oscillospiraceae bacterium]